MKLYAYKNGSASARALAGALGIKILLHDGKLWKKTNEAIINWGSSTMDGKNWFDEQVMINDMFCVKNASNKLTSFQLFTKAGVATPEWTQDREEAVGWLAGGTVVARTILNGHSGAGIVICDGAENIPQAPLYTKYIKKDQEYRLHVMKGEVFFVQRKARKVDVPDDQVNWQVRNHQNGFIYANQGIEVPRDMHQLAIEAVKALGLDFGAVDCITEKKSQKSYVLEVNTACGLTGATLDAYVQKFKELG